MKRREFTRLTSFATLIIPYQKLFGSLIDPEQTNNLDDIKTKCFAAFNRFESIWKFNDFWKRGNTFDACLTFADALHKKWPADAGVISIQKRIDGMLEENYKYFK